MSGALRAGLRAVTVGATIRAGARLFRYASGERTPSPWRRRNFHDRSVDLRLGPLVASGLLAGVSGAPRMAEDLAGILAVGGAAAAGYVDDVYGDHNARGLKGHLGALHRGQITTGVVKIAVICGTGIAAAALTRPPDVGTQDHRAPYRSLLDAVAGGGVIAGTANLANLLDLRPGRAMKAMAIPAAMIAATPGPGRRQSAAVLGSVAFAAPDDLGERAMLGDCGANALGAAVGLAMVGRLGTAGRVVALSVLAGLTLASEKVSFSRIIDDSSLLTAIDGVGRLREKTDLRQENEPRQGI